MAIAESVVAREEAASERAFDPAFRAKAKELLATLPLAELVSQTGEDGLGLNSLGDSQADLVYTPVTPCRIIDTRNAGGAIAGGTTRSFLVTGTDYSAQGGKATGCGVPYGPTTAVMVNFVAAKPAGGGNVRVTPFGKPIPLAAILNFTTGVTLGNGLAVATCDPSSATCTSDITIQVDQNATDLVADVQGYYQRVTTGGVSTALLADSAVTAPKIGTGVVVRSLNSQTDAVTLAGSNGLGVTQGSGTVTVSSNATATNTAGAIVARDGTGSFSAGSVDLAGNLNLPATTSATVGVITIGGVRFLHNFGEGNTFAGPRAGNMSMTGRSNTGVGDGALYANTSGSSNSAFGSSALYVNTEGGANCAFGNGTLFLNTTGVGNCAFGNDALNANTSGGQNSAFGYAALNHNQTGLRNIGLGYFAGTSLTAGNDNIYIDNEGVASESGTIRIGTVGRHTATFMAGISGHERWGVAVLVNSLGKLGIAPSSRRYKEDIVDMGAASDVLMRLRPVAFRYRPEYDETRAAVRAGGGGGGGGGARSRGLRLERRARDRALPLRQRHAAERGAEAAADH